MTTTYRAAYWISADRQATVRLTTDDQAHLSEDALMAAALAEAETVGLQRAEGDDILIGDWAE